MGWDTTLTCSLIFNRKTYTSLAQVEEDLREEQEYVNMYKKKIQNFAMMTEPQKFCSEDYSDDPMSWIQNSIQDILIELEESYWKIMKLEYLVENWNKCHDPETGYALSSRERPCFLTGDFLPCIYPDGEIYNPNTKS